MESFGSAAVSPGSTAYDTFDDEAAIASSLSSPREVAGGELPLYLSGEHFLGSGVTSLPYNHAKALLKTLISTPSIAVNPAYVAKLKGSKLFTESGRSDVMIPLLLSSVTVSPKANARGQLAIIVRESGACLNSAAPDDRSWLFQIDSRLGVLDGIIDKLCAAGAVLDIVMDPSKHVQVTETSRAVVYATPQLSLLQDARSEAVKDDIGSADLEPCSPASSMGQYNFRAVKLFKVPAPAAPEEGPTSSASEPPTDVAKEFKMLVLAQKHKSILLLHGLVRVPAGWALITDWYEAGSLLHHLTADGRQSESQAQRLQRQLLAGLGHLHQRGIIHRDVKLDHILLRSRSKLALGGFSLAAPVSEARDAVDPVGTVGYMAPEVIRYTPALEPADVFAAGVVLYTMLLGRQPFGGETPAEETKYRTTCTEADYTGLIFQNASGLCHRLLQSLLQKDPVERPTAAAAVEDDWFLTDPATPGKASVEVGSPSSRGSLTGSRRKSALEMFWRRPSRPSSARPARKQQAGSLTSDEACSVKSSQPTTFLQEERRSPKSLALSRFRTWLHFRKRDDMLDCTQLSAVVQR